MLNILSLGAGVQSTTLLLMALNGNLVYEYGPAGGRLHGQTNMFGEECEGMCGV